MAGDTLYNNVNVLLKFDTGITDLSSHAVPGVANGTVTLSTDCKFGTNSLRFDGPNSALNLTSSYLPLGRGDFTVECFVKVLSYGDGVYIFDSFTNGGYGSGYELLIGPNGIPYYYLAGIGVVYGPSAVPANEWAHLALVRSTGIIKLYLNGVPSVGTNFSSDISTTVLAIGSNWQGILQSKTGSYLLDSIRITSGATRYTGPFTPPTQDFPQRGWALSGVVLDSHGQGVSRVLRAYRRDTGALVGVGSSSSLTGAYTFEVSHDGEVQVILLDDDSGTVENDQIVRAYPA